MVFQSFTVNSVNSDQPGGVIRRPLLKDLFQQRQRDGSNVIISGPAGSGKTILALSAALERKESVQYICARDIPDSLPLEMTTAGDGQLVADFLNHLMLSHKPNAMEQIRLLVEQINSASAANQAMFVLDDLDLLPMIADVDIRDMILYGEPILSDATIVLVTRNSYERLVGIIGDTAQTRIISSNLLKVTHTELDALAEHESFGHASAEDLLLAWEEAGGWFKGIEFALNSTPASTSAIDDYVLNEILIRLPRATGLVVHALSKFPSFSSELVDHLFNELGGEQGAQLFSQLPLVSGGLDETGAELFSLPEVIRQSLNRLVLMIESQSTVRDLQVAGISWLVNRGGYGQAKALATAAGAESVFLDLVHPICAGLAEQELWNVLREILSGISMEYIEDNPDLEFWMMIIELYNGNVKALSKMRWARDPEGKTLTDPKQKGRTKLMLAWRFWSQSLPEKTLNQSEQAFDLFPPSALQERMFAAITAEMAARNIGDTRKVDLWSTRSSTNRPAGALRQEFWHRIARYHRVNHLALSGKLSNALDFSKMLRDQADPSYSRAPFSYHILSSYIYIENGDLQAAKDHLQQAEQFSDNVVTGNQLSLHRASYALASGDFEGARVASRVEGPAVKSRADYYFHRLRLMAEVELAVENYEIASDLIHNWCGGETAWPKHFLVKSKVLARLGDYRGAIAAAQFVINESRRRGHLSFMISALAIQAECHHCTGKMEKRNLAVHAAKEVAGSDLFKKIFLSVGPRRPHACENRRRRASGRDEGSHEQGLPFGSTDRS